MWVIYTILFLFNLVFALGIKAMFDDEKSKRYLGSIWVRVFLLIPPVSLTIFLCVLLYGVVYTLYLLLDSYLSD